MITEFKLTEDGKMTDFTISIEKLLGGDEGKDKTYKSYVGTVSVSKEFGPVEYGFAFVIDMSYKGKPDQYTENFITLTPFIEYEDFKEICKQNNIDIIQQRAKKF